MVKPSSLISFLAWRVITNCRRRTFSRMRVRMRLNTAAHHRSVGRTDLHKGTSTQQSTFTRQSRRDRRKVGGYGRLPCDGGGDAVLRAARGKAARLPVRAAVAPVQQVQAPAEFQPALILAGGAGARAGWPPWAGGGSAPVPSTGQAPRGVTRRVRSGTAGIGCSRPPRRGRRGRSRP